MSRNERLLDAINRMGKTPSDIASALDVDPKTVARWLALGRTPYARHRHQIAAMLAERESWLWPDANSPAHADVTSQAEVICVYSHRALVPSDLWSRMFQRAAKNLDILVYAGLFLPEQKPELSEWLATQASCGTRVRLLFGNPDSEAVRVRGAEEGIGDAVSTKIRNALFLYRTLAATDVEVRLHSTTLYTSIYRSDDEMIANPHVLGLPAAQSPALHIRRLPGASLFETYRTVFDRVWDCAIPAWKESEAG